MHEMTFKFGAIEPFFCTLALYDYKEKRKISEDFYFQLNTPEQLELIGTTVRRTEIFSARSFLAALMFYDADILLTYRVQWIHC